MAATSEETVLQRKDGESTVTWREYEALRDHLKRAIDTSTDGLEEEFEAVKTKVASTDATVTNIQTSVNDMQATMTTMQANMTRLEQALNRLNANFEANQNYDDAASQDGVDEEFDAGQNQGQPIGRGRGGAYPGRGRGFFPVGEPRAQRVAAEDDVFGKPKFTIPKFLGKDAEEYLNWELRMESLWRLHECTDDKKIKLAASEFDEYAVSWWDNACSIRRDNNMVPITTWRDMKAEMRHRFVPPNYTRSLYDKLTNLKQGYKSVDEYY